MATTEARPRTMQHDEHDEGATSREVTFPVTGMTCASCVRRIEKALGKVEGVADASVNLATEKARVVYDPARATTDDLRHAVENAGYGVREMPASPAASGAPSAPAASPTSTSAESGSGDVVLAIDGMTCASCVRRIEKSLAKVPGVREASVNLATEKAHVVFDPAIAGREQFGAAVERAGYKVRALEALPAQAGAAPAGAIGAGTASIALPGPPPSTARPT